MGCWKMDERISNLRAMAANPESDYIYVHRDLSPHPDDHNVCNYCWCEPELVRAHDIVKMSHADLERYLRVLDLRN